MTDRQLAERIAEALEDIRDNYDCDTSEGGKHDPSRCRCCKAAAVLSDYRAMRENHPTLTDTLAAALEGLLKVLTEPPSRSGYIADGYRHGNAVDRSRKALEEYRNNTPTTPCTPSSQDPN